MSDPPWAVGGNSSRPAARAARGKAPRARPPRREGELTAALELPGTDVRIMLDQDDSDTDVGPFFVVDSVADFYERNKDTLKFRWEPREIPPGLYTAFDDPSGNPIRVMDATKER